MAVVDLPLYNWHSFGVAINYVARSSTSYRTIGWMSACGADGSALHPFITGTIASNLGIESLQPLCVSIPVLQVFEIHSFFIFYFIFQSFSDDDYFGYGLGLCT